MAGCIGIGKHPKAAEQACQGLLAFQGRGETGYGIAVVGEEMLLVHGKGKITHSISQERLTSLPGLMAIGYIHKDPATIGDQPFKACGPYGPMAICFDGKILNREALRLTLVSRGAIFQSRSDAEIVCHLIACSQKQTLLQALVHCLQQISGSFSMLLLTMTELLTARDPQGFLPLCLGVVGDTYITCSETCALDLLGASYVREVDPGEIVSIGSAGEVRSSFFAQDQSISRCIFEHLHFARPDSLVFSREVNEVRTAFGRKLGTEAPVEAEVVVPILEGGRCGAIGFSEVTGIPWRIGLIRNQYVGRVASAVSDRVLESGVRIKHNPVVSVLKNQRVVIVDDVIARGYTIRQIVKLLKQAKAREIHIRIASPPNAFGCHYREGVPKQEDLLARVVTLNEIRQYLEADSVAFLSYGGMLEVLGKHAPSYCTACYSGNYPIK